MICFVVSKNGKRLCRAGIDSECVLSAMVTYVDVTDPGPKRRTRLDASITGMNSTNREHVEWQGAQVKPGDRIEIHVRDNGPGIPDNIKEKIFQPFFTTKPTGQGTGLGLSLSYDIVKAHGGELKVKSSENEGTEFIIHLPLP